MLYTMTDSQKISKERFSYEYSGRHKHVSITEIWDSYAHSPKVGVAIEGWNYLKNNFGEDNIAILFFTEEYGRVWFHFVYEKVDNCGVMVIG